MQEVATEMVSQERFTVFAFFSLLAAASGGILFGYHTAIISGILTSVKESFYLSTLDQGFLVSIILIGGLLGALLAGRAADRKGRKKVLIVTAFVFCFGSLICAISYSYPGLLLGRLFTGVGLGLSSVVTPIYLAEIAPPRFRGRFVSSYQLFIAGGILTAYSINLYFEKTEQWHVVFYIAFILSLVQLILLFFISETPVWLLTPISHTFGEKQKDATTRRKGGFKRLIAVGLILSIFQQITGINTVIFYAPKIFETAQESSPLLITFFIGTVNLIFTILSVIFIDKLGRRFFLLTGISAMIIGQILLTVSSRMPIFGIIGALIYISGFAISLGPITWVLLSEIYPMKIRGKAMGIAIFANWLFNYIVSLTFLLHIEKFGMSLTFIFYGCISFLCLIFIYFFIPETKNKSLEEIESLALQGKL